MRLSISIKKWKQRVPEGLHITVSATVQQTHIQYSKQQKTNLRVHLSGTYHAAARILIFFFIDTASVTPSSVAYPRAVGAYSQLPTANCHTKIALVVEERNAFYPANGYVDSNGCTLRTIACGSSEKPDSAAVVQ